MERGGARRLGLILAFCWFSSQGPGRADDAKPPAAGDLLFDRPQLAATAPGTVLTYSYRRTSNNTGVFGPDVADTIRLSVGKGRTGDTRTVTVEMLSGPNRKAAGPFEDMTGNPILSLVLEDSVQQLSARLGANPRYLKTAIRTALRERAEVATDSQGESAHAWRITIAPFEGDPNARRMGGLEGLVYRFTVNDRVPGQIAEIDITARDGAGAVLFKERVAYDTAD